MRYRYTQARTFPWSGDEPFCERRKWADAKTRHELIELTQPWLQRALTWRILDQKNAPERRELEQWSPGLDGLLGDHILFANVASIVFIVEALP